MTTNQNYQPQMMSVIEGLNKPFLASVKEGIIQSLSSEIEIEKLNAIFNLEKGTEILNEKELKSLLKRLYAFSKIEELNPTIIFKTEKQHRMYNKSFKEEFIIDTYYDDKSAQNMRIIFSKTEKSEAKLNKDIYNFNDAELEELFHSFKAKSLRSIQNYISKLNKYIEYALAQNVITENAIRKYSRSSEVEKFIDDNAKENTVFNRDAIMKMAEYADNAQDGVSLALIFDGVSYKDKYSELVELTIDMIDMENNLIHLPARKEGDVMIEARTIEMSDMTRTLVRRAIEDKEYISITGETSRTYKITEGNHILRGLRAGREKINWRNINQRIIRVAKVNDEEFLNATNISYSGQLYYAKKLIETGKKLEDVIDSILIRFGFPINKASRFYLKKRIERHMKL